MFVDLYDALSIHPTLVVSLPFGIAVELIRYDWLQIACFVFLRCFIGERESANNAFNQSNENVTNPALGNVSTKQ